MSLLIFATFNFHVTLISRFFLNREIREINVSRKFHVIVYIAQDVASVKSVLRNVEFLFRVL